MHEVLTCVAICIYPLELLNHCKSICLIFSLRRKLLYALVCLKVIYACRKRSVPYLSRSSVFRFSDDKQVSAKVIAFSS